MAIQLPQGPTSWTGRLQAVTRSPVFGSGLPWLFLCFHLHTNEMVWSHLTDPVLMPRAGFV